MPTSADPGRPPVVPGYVVERLLGRGGSGEVWRARPRAGGAPVAVKVLVTGDPARQAREAALLGELDHPHLVHLHEVVRRSVRGGPEQVSLVLDLLPGGTLAALLARRGRLRAGEVVTAVAPVAAALAHAHERGVVHGDLSPGNIVFTAEGRPVLTDLGVARVLGDAARAEVTPAYVDPTVARGGASGPASDVFGVAAAAFHALTGIAPWNAAGPAETLRVAASGELPDLDLLAPEAPRELRDVIRRGMSAEPHRRGSAAAFALDLRHSCRPEPVRLPAAGVPDEELAVSARGPRTELTHLVPGRRAAGVHAAPASPSPSARLRAALGAGRRQPEPAPVSALLLTVSRRVAVVAAVVAAVVTAAWLGARWGGGAAGAGEPPGPVVTASTGTGGTGVHGPLPPVGADRPGAVTTEPPAADGEPPAADGEPSAGNGEPSVGAGGPSADTRGPSVGTGEPSVATIEPSVATGGRAPAAPGDTPDGASTGLPGSGSATPPAPVVPAGASPAPGELAAWRQVLSALYRSRAEAFTAADRTVLDDVYAPGSRLGARDGDQIEALHAAGERVEGFTPTVLRVDGASVDGARAELLLVDAVPDYRVVPDPATGSVARQISGRGAQRVTAVLTRGPDGWRLAEAIRTPDPSG